MRFAVACLILVMTLAGQTTAIDLNALEQRAQKEFDGRDCSAAEKTYAEALQAAISLNDIHRTGLYYARIGNCRTRAGDFTASLEAYRHLMAVADSTGDNELMALGTHGAALQLQKLGRMEEAVPMGEREYELARACDHPSHLARAMWLVAELYEATGRVRDGVQMMARALSISRKTNDNVLTGALLSSLATSYFSLGDLETAAHMERELLALPEISSMSSTYSPAITYNNLGEIQLRSGHRAEARQSFEKAVAASTRPDDWRAHADALLNLAGRQNEVGQITQADTSFHEAMRIVDRVQLPDMHSTAWQMRSDQLLVRRDIKGAIAAGQEALQTAKQLGSPSRKYKALISLGAANAEAGEHHTARELFDEALGIADTIRAQSPGEVSDLGRAYANLVPLYQAAVQNLLDLNLPAEALRRAEEAKARVLMDILLRGGADERKAMSPDEAATQESLRKRLAKASDAALQNAMVEYRQFRRTLYENHPELAVRSADFDAADLPKLSTLLRGSETALLDYFFVPKGVALFVVRQPEGAHAPQITTYLLPDPNHTLAAEARKFREQLARRDLDYKIQARRLFDRLLAPAMVALLGTTEWIVSPDGALWDVPFAALIDAAGHHVIETRAVTLTPSLTASIKIQQRARPASRQGIELLAIGNPLPSADPLPDAVREVATIASHYPRGAVSVLTGTSATAAAFLQQAPAARVVHLAAHAGLNDVDPLSSFVRLGNQGVLTALDIMSLKLTADMVVLSACETALGTTGPGEGMIGMGWALTAAGSSSSVLSLWKVDSAASREFMTSFYSRLGASFPRSKALRSAGLAMLGSAAYRHPFYWAAFSLWGDGGLASPK